jgi:hypothetical protein
MSMATRTDTQSPALHVADSHDLIRVQGARDARCPSLVTQVPRSAILGSSYAGTCINLPLRVARMA